MYINEKNHCINFVDIDIVVKKMFFLLEFKISLILAKLRKTDESIFFLILINYYLK